ncbi:hypothetical protein Tco_0409526 [Tanacetum coccineum]
MQGGGCCGCFGYKEVTKGLLEALELKCGDGGACKLLGRLLGDFIEVFQVQSSQTSKTFKLVEFFLHVLYNSWVQRKKRNTGTVTLIEFEKYLVMVHLNQLISRKVNQLKQQKLEQQLQELDDQHMVEDESIHQTLVVVVYPSHLLLVGQKVLKKEVVA